MPFPEVGISFGGSVFLFFTLLAIVITGMFFYYRFTVPPLPSRKRWFLAILRGTALTIILMLVFEPLLRLLFHEKREPQLAVLIDASESMTIAHRDDEIREFLKTDPFETQPYTASYYTFSSRLTKLPTFLPDSIRFDGETTDLAAALAELQSDREHNNIQGILLISDGVYTVGRNPLSAIDDLDLPLFTVGVGDTTERRDVLIANVTTNNIVYAETRVPVTVRVRSSGYRNETAEVVLAHGSNVLDRRVLQLREGTRDYSLSLSYQPTEEGTQRYTVSVSTLPGELTERNNVSSFFVKVLKTRLRLLLLAGAPSPDVTAVKQTLKEDQRFFVTSLVQRRAGEFYEGNPTQALFDTTDCLVLIGFPSAATSPAILQRLVSVVEGTKKPMLFIAAKTLDFEKLRMLESVLPFSWSTPRQQEMLVAAEIPEKHRGHVLVQLNGEVTFDSWQQLPPIFKTETIVRQKAESDVLAFASTQSIALAEPLILTRNIARQKSIAITGHGIWRWRLLAQGNTRTEQFLPLFLTNAIRWLTTTDEGKPVRVQPTTDAFTTAEAVEFTGEVYDAQLRPVDNAEVRVTVSSKDRRVETVLQNIGNGRYEGLLEGLGAGEYTYTAKATRDASVLGEDRGRFSVGEMNVEFLETKMNKSLLEQLAFRTNGVYADIDNAAALVDSIRERVTFVPKQTIHVREIELWNWQYLTGLLVLLLAVEWFVRKKSGML